MQNVTRLLSAQLNPTAVADLDTCVRMQAGTEPDAEHFDVALAGGALTFAPAGMEPEWTLYFTSWEMAAELLQGRRPLIDAFMQGDLRASGYIVWAFRLLSACLPHQSEAT